MDSFNVNFISGCCGISGTVTFCSVSDLSATEYPGGGMRNINAANIIAK